MFKIRYVLNGDVRYYEKIMVTRILPESGILLRFKRARILAKVDRIIFDVESEATQEQPCFDIYLRYAGNILVSQHQLLVADGWKMITEDQAK